MTNGTMTINMSNFDYDGELNFYQKRSKLLGGGSPDITRDTKVGSTITCESGKITKATLTNFDPNKWYYITMSGKFTVDSAELIRTK